MEDTAIPINAEFRLDEGTGTWIATSLQAPKLVARGLDPKQARIRLGAMLEEHLGKEVNVIEHKLKLPKVLADEVEAYNRDLDQLEALAKKCEEGRLPLANKLMRHRLHQKQIAGLLRISGTWLGQQLKKESTTAEIPANTGTKSHKSK